MPATANIDTPKQIDNRQLKTKSNDCLSVPIKKLIQVTDLHQMNCMHYIRKELISCYM